MSANKRNDKTTFLDSEIFKKVLVISFFVVLFFVAKQFQKDIKIFLYLKWFFLYAAFLLLLSVLIKYRTIKLLYLVFNIPVRIILITGPIVQILGAFIFTYISIIGILTVFILLSQEWFNYKLNFLAGTYLVLTLTSVVATSFGNRMIKSWHYAQDRLYREGVQNFSLLLFGQEKIRYLLFALYFILLIIFTFSNLNRMPIFNKPGVDIAVLQSFATYVAYDRLVTNWSSFLKKSNK